MTQVSGRVHDTDGTPVPGAAVTLVGGSGGQIASASTDRAGAFAVPAPGRGGYVLIISAAGHQPEAATVNVLDVPVVFDPVLRPASGLRGVVRAAETSVPIMSAVVTLTDLRGEVVESRISGSGGEYAFPTLVPGTYTLAANAPGYRPAAITVTIDGETAVQRDVELADGAVILGSVRLPEGPRPEITVTLLDETGRVVRTTHPDVSGRYAFYDLQAGSYTIVATSYAPSRDSVRITAGARTLHDVRLN
jgi:Carboxypeptidase regulatory-like domain